MVPLTFTDPEDLEAIEQGDELALDDIVAALDSGEDITLHNRTRDQRYTLRHDLSRRQIDMIRHGSLIELVRQETK